MKNLLIVVIGAVMALLLISCQQLNNDLDSINKDLAQTNNQASADSPQSTLTTKSISNKWHVTDAQAMAWLAHNDRTWDDKGKLKGVNWFTFWSQQIHYKTALGNKAHDYCNVKSWDNRRVGNNCTVYDQAGEMTASEEMTSSAERYNKGW